MRQSDHEYEERSFGDIQRAIDFENSMNDLESQLYYQHLSPKEVAQQVLKATCQFYDADWCGLMKNKKKACLATKSAQKPVTSCKSSRNTPERANLIFCWCSCSTVSDASQMKRHLS